MPERHKCEPCARCGHADAGSCLDAEGRLCPCGNPLHWDCVCPDGCEAA